MKEKIRKGQATSAEYYFGNKIGTNSAASEGTISEEEIAEELGIKQLFR